MASLLDATRSLWASVLNGGAARKPSSPATADRPSRLKFAEPCATTHAVEPAPRELRDEVWWTARDYAEIRQKQRALALEALRQARAAPAGTTPPPIPGESRRGLGVCCEPGTTAERARLVQEGRAEVVRAHRGGMEPAALAELCRELSAWAAVNARDVASKDELDASTRSDAGHASASDLLAVAARPPAPPSTPPAPTKRGADDEPAAASPAKRPASPATASGGFLAGAPRDNAPAAGIGIAAEPPPAGVTAPCQAGLASMVRSDSFGDLRAAGS